jgi:hypothetical protein
MVVSTRVTWNDFLVLSFSGSRTTLNENKYVLAWDPETSISAKLYSFIMCLFIYLILTVTLLHKIPCY